MNITQWLSEIVKGDTVDDFAIFGIIGVMATIFWSTLEDKRFIRLYDLYVFVGSSIFVVAIATLVGINPLLSFVIGLAPERVYKTLKKKGVYFSINENKQLVIGLKEVRGESRLVPKMPRRRKRKPVVKKPVVRRKRKVVKTP